jgi:hypothetical protein
MFPLLRISVQVQKLETGGVQAFGLNLGDSFQQCVSKITVDGALFPENHGVEGDNPTRFQCPGVKPPLVGWYQPGPADNIACTEGLDAEILAVGTVQFQPDQPVLNQVKAVGRTPFVEQETTLGIDLFMGAFQKSIQSLVFKTLAIGTGLERFT